ncbi:MAG: hypothetical protein H7Y18_16375, partial [Clostridiaceae bacterium]|nr:hypothetical protein [Clostridiaceae bacterium]
NALGTADTVVVPSLAIGDIVKVYSAATLGTLLGSATATAAGSLTVSIAQIGAGAGSVYVTVTSKNMLESPRSAAVTVAAEAKSVTPVAANIVATNKITGIPDTIVVPSLAIGDIVKVYSAATAGTLLGSATATAAGSLTVNIAQLGTALGNVYVTVTSKALLESDRSAAVAYGAEAKSTTPIVANITLANYADIADVITVTGLSAGDIVKVYTVSSGGTVIATSKAVAIGKTGISFNVAQLGLTSGSVYLSVTSTGKNESDRTIAVAFASEP